MSPVRFSSLAVMCGAALLFSQTPPPAARTGDPAIRVTVNLVEVDALVTDSTGRHVPDLKPEDFTVLEDGKAQKITQFTHVNPAPSLQEGRMSAIAGPTPPMPVKTPRREDVHRTIVLMIDNLHTHMDDIGTIAPVIRKFVREQVMPGDLVSVMGTKSGMGLYESFTSDRRQLEAAIEKALRITGDNRPQESTTGNGTPNPIMHDGMEDVNNYYTELYHAMAMNALRRAVEGMRDIPGRKAIVFFSDGIMLPPPSSLDSAQTAFRMTERTEEIAALANRYGVVLNTFDPAGLLTPMSMTRPMGGGQGSRISLRGPSNPLPQQLALTQTADAMALHEIPAFQARETGGVAVKNTNELGNALGKAMDDMTGYYLLAYQPQREPARPGSPEREHRIQVRVHRSGLHVRSRKDYTDAIQEVTDGAPATREQQLGKALFSPFAAGGIGVHVTPLYSASAPDEKTERRQPLLRVALAADGSDIQFKDVPEGGRQAVLDLVVALYDADDHQLSIQDKRYTLQATAAQAEAFKTGVVEYQVDLPVPKAGPYQVRAAIRDDTTGKLGSAYTFLQIPDFNKPGLSLSSLVLGDANGSSTQTASRQFAPGAQMSYGCRLFGAPSGSGTPLEVEVKLFREGQQVYASNPMPLSIPAGMKEVPVTGKLNLTDKFLPGEYAMEFIAHDKLGGIDRQAWMDFSIATR